MGKVRAKRIYQNPNRFFEFWLINLSKEFKYCGRRMSNVYAKALVSLRKYPLKLSSGQECRILNGFGVGICNVLDQKLQEFAELHSLSLSDALELGNSLSPTKLLEEYSLKSLESSSEQPSTLPQRVPSSRCPIKNLPDSCVSEQDVPHSDFLAGGSYEIILLIDIRETFGMAKLREVMSMNGVKWEPRSLPVGDFIWIARKTLGSKEEEFVLGLVIERKRADDLASSIVDGRFMEQKGRMQKLGFRKLYLFEECRTMYNLRISYETLLQAMVNAQLIDEYEFITCTSSEQCAVYLASMTRRLITKSEFDCAIYSNGLRPRDLRNAEHLWGIPWHEYSSIGKKSPALSLRDQFGRHLLQIHSITGSKAEDIVTVYPTPKSLFDAYDGLLSEDQKKLMLMQRSQSIGLRSINKKTSEIIFHLYNCV